MATKKASSKKGGAKKGGAKKGAAKGQKLSLGGLLGAVNPCHIRCIRDFLVCVKKPGADKKQCAIRLGECIIKCK